MNVKLIDVADVIRSKNAGPYELTFDIIFKDEDTFDKVCQKNSIDEKLIASLYDIDEKDIINIIHFKPAKAIKATIKRPMSSGALGESDVYGAQQHAPLLAIEFEL